LESKLSKKESGKKYQVAGTPTVSKRKKRVVKGTEKGGTASKMGVG